MAKNRPGSAKDAMGQQQAAFRRGAPGRRFIGDADAQRAKAVGAERKKVHRMAEVDAAERTAETVGVPVIALLADVVQSAVRIGGVLVRAPFSLARALLGPQHA
jgi:hypothetical protein